MKSRASVAALSIVKPSLVLVSLTALDQSLRTVDGMVVTKIIGLILVTE